MTEPPERVWRVFPWDPEASARAPFSPEYVPPIQGKGRFDLPGVAGGVLYLAETPEHAVGERIQHLRGQTLDEADLRVQGMPLALASVGLPTRIRAGVVDLCDPRVLARLDIRPDETASRDRRTTQRIAADLHAGGDISLRWWSALIGDWHTIVLFRDRIGSSLEYGVPEPLTLDHPAVQTAARILGIRRGGR